MDYTKNNSLIYTYDNICKEYAHENYFVYLNNIVMPFNSLPYISNGRLSLVINPYLISKQYPYVPVVCDVFYTTCLTNI